MTTYPGETWLPITGYEEFYEASDLGRIRRLKYRKGPRGANWPYLQPSRHRSGHLVVTLSGKQGKKLFKVHRIVLETFAGPCPEGFVARHLNGDPADNRLLNLIWGTYRQNLEDDTRNGILRNAGKTHCPKGHEYTPENTYIQPGRGGRSCLTCRKQAFQDYLEKTQSPDAPRCDEPECANGSFARGLCRKHYDQQRNSHVTN